MTQEEFEDCLYDTFKARYPDEKNDILEAYIQYHNDLGLDYPDKSPRYIVDNLHDNAEYESLINCINYHKNENNDTFLYDKMIEYYSKKHDILRSNTLRDLEKIALENEDYNIIYLGGCYMCGTETFEEAVEDVFVVYSFGV